jgi:hypothetical protein
MPVFTSSTFGNYTKKWLVGTGIFELLLAAGFAVGAFMIPVVRGGFLLTAGLLGLTGILLIAFGLRAGAKAAEAERIDETGIPGRATITGLSQTGMYLNENPQVEMNLLVDVPGRAPYQATRKEFVPLILLARLASGAPLAVKVDPADPSKVIVDWDAPAPMPGGMGNWGAGTWGAPGSWGAGTGTPAGWGAGAAGTPTGSGGASGVPPAPAAPGATPGTWATQGAWGASGNVPQPPGGVTDETLSQVQQALRAGGVQAPIPFASAEQGQYSIEQLRSFLRANGLSGTARIERLQDTGQVVGDERLMTMEVTLNVPGRPPYRGPSSAAMVPIHAANKVAVGKTIPVKVAADNPNMVMFEWEKI